MRRLNGVYTQGYNLWHGKVGHVCQGRFKAILLDRDASLFALCGLYRHLLGRRAQGAGDHRQAAKRYAALVASAPDLQIWPTGLRQQFYLGDEQFVDRMQALMAAARIDDRDIPQPQRLPVKPLEEWLAQSASREEGLQRAHTQEACR